MRSQSTGFIKPYPAYKPSGIPWLRDVPDHRDIVQLGRIGVFSKGSGGTKEDEVPSGIPCVRYGDIYTTHKHFISQTRSYITPAKAVNYTKIQRGDILFPASGETIEEIGKSAVNIMDAPVYCGGDLIIFRPTTPIDPRFAGYALDAPCSQDQKSRSQQMSLTRVIRPGIFTDISPPRARVIWTCIRLQLASQSPPPSPATSGAGKVFPGSWSPR